MIVAERKKNKYHEPVINKKIPAQMKLYSLYLIWNANRSVMTGSKMIEYDIVLKVYIFKKFKSKILVILAVKQTIKVNRLG